MFAQTTRWSHRLALVPALLLFQARVGLQWLNPLRAPSMMVGDWSTYILAPNFLRHAPVLSFPLGSVPHYLSPVGSSLGNSDAAPYLLPVYRALLPVFGARPFQLVGLLLLCGYLGTYSVVQRYALRLIVARGDAELTARAQLVLSCLAALTVTANPFLAARILHPSLLQHWVLVGALVFVISRTVLIEASWSPDRAFVFTRRDGIRIVGWMAAAAAINPYLLPMVSVVFVPMFLAGGGALLRRLGWAAAGAIGAGVIAFSLGYVGSGKRLRVNDFGDYNADLLSALNPFRSSRLLAGWTPKVDDFEGRSFIGLGAALLLGFAVWLIITNPAARAMAARSWFVALTCTAAVLCAALPVVRAGGFTLLSTQVGKTASTLSRAVGIFRTNGRFSWPFAYLLLLLAVTLVLIYVRRAWVLVVVVLGAAMLQIADTRYGTTPHTDPHRYEVAHRAVVSTMSRGARHLRVQPPWIIYECGPPNINDIAPVLLAASVLGMSVDSGYPARGDARYARDICTAHAIEFAKGVRHKDVAYLLRTNDPGVATFQSCEPLVDPYVLCTPTATTR